MKLSRLELSGFKSFADTVSLAYEPGVTAIVGPNGCGKSNVSDAVRWVLGEQSARLLRGGKMEDVIFQGSTARRPVNVTEVSLYLDNSDGELPVAWQEVVITRRLSRSGQSDYLLNGTVVRLRDIQDLLRGTGLGSDAGVVIEARMIELLLSDRADERRSLFEEAAGIGLYRDRKQSTERRLEETAQDLQRVEDLIAEVQSQIRSLARQKGKTERHGKLSEEKFAVQLTLAHRLLAALADDAAGLEARHGELGEQLPAARTALAGAEDTRGTAAEARALAEARRTELDHRLAALRLELERLEGQLRLADERLKGLEERRQRALAERSQFGARAEQALAEERAVAGERDAARTAHAELEAELTRRAGDEEASRSRVADGRQQLRQGEHALQAHFQDLRTLEGERLALEAEIGTLREQVTHAETHRGTLRGELAGAERRRDHLGEQSSFRAREARSAADQAERARHQVAEARDHEALERAARRQAEETLAQLAARRHALEELERERVGLAPAAAALLGARERFGDGVLGPLSDFVTSDRADAALAERLLGEWMHAVLVRDESVVAAIRRWHAETEPGTLVLLPATPGPSATGGFPLDRRLTVDPLAEGWVRAALAGSEVLDDGGRALRRPSGAIFLSGAAAPSGPLQRRAELGAVTEDAGRAETALLAATAALDSAVARHAAAEGELAASASAADTARETARQADAARDDAARLAANLTREAAEADQQVGRLGARLQAAERRLTEVDSALLEGDRARAALEGTVDSARARVQELELAHEAAREDRVQWQVQEAHVAARLRAAVERAERAAATRLDAEGGAGQLANELAQLAEESAELEGRRAEWSEAQAGQRAVAVELERALAAAETALGEATTGLADAEEALQVARARVETLADEAHRVELGVSEVAARRRSITDRVEAEWKRPMAELLAGAPLLDLDLEALESEAGRITAALDAIGPVNPLAVEEHAEETRRLEFLIAQRDDLVSARQSLLLAIREIDGTARDLFLQTFTAVQGHFRRVFTTLFGGGECDLRLATPDEPLESEIEIHAAPRGKRTQRIHLLSTGERTLVAVSLLFSIYLTKPSPFCLMDEVDAPLDDANVGRFIRLLEEFKGATQFIVITHNPRTMQAADAVYGVTMQEPGVSTIVGVRLAQHEAA